MKILVAYTCVTNGTVTEEFASRFVASYLTFPAGREHELVIVCNGGPLSYYRGGLFTGLNCGFLPRSNNGWDLGGYREVANGIGKTADLLLCLGESVYFQAPNWLDRLAECFQKHGPGMYGFFSSHIVRAHLGTTAFATTPALLNSYTRPFNTRKDRYEFEHGKDAFWRLLAKRGIGSWLVTWDGCWNPMHWRLPPNIMFRGDQSNLLMRCNHTDRYEAASPKTKLYWQRACDQPFH